MLKYISKLEENGITYSQQNLDDYFEAFIQQSFDVYTPVKYKQTLDSIPPTACKQVVILYVSETKSLKQNPELNIQLQSFLQQKNVVLLFTPFQNVFKILNSLEISNKAVLLLSSGMEVLSNGVDKMFRMLNTEPELKYVNSYFKDDFKWYSYGHEYGFLNLYYNYTPPFMMVKFEDGNIPVFKHDDFKVNIWEYSISLANQGKCGYTMSECLVKCPGNMFPEGNRMHSLITKIRKKYPKVYTDPLEYPFVDRTYSNGEIITDKYKNCEYEPDYRHYGLTRRDFILQMLENIKPPFSHPKNKKSENNNVVNKRDMDETIHDKIFVTLPTFNRGEKCIQVIQNIIDQKYTNWKLYVIDDGSEKIHGDKIKQFIEKCDKKYDIEYVRNDVNLKLPKTLNVSIQQFLKSDCEYFTWVSDDNEYYHNFLEDLHCEISKENVDFVYSGWDENIEGTSEIRYKNPTYNFFEDVLNTWDGMASFMWTKQLISQIGWYNIDIHGGEDYDYILRLFLFTKNVSNLNKSTMKYIVNSIGSISSDIKLCQQIKFNILEFYNNLNITSFNLSNTQQKSFIYYSTIFWTKLFQRPHQIMRFMSKDYFKVFLTSENIFTFEDKYNLWIIPNKYKHFVINFFKDSIIYFTDTRLYYEIIDNKTQNSKLLYDLIDAPIDEFSVWKNNLDVCVKNSDYVIYSHPKLIEFLQDIDKSKKYTYISNACDVEHFSKAQHRIREYPSEFPKTDKKILGYYGSFSRWLDFNLIKKYADEGEYHIVMIGGLPENNEYNVRIEHKNITWIDHQSYEKLPYYLSWFDTCFIPFKKCQLNEYVNPCKLWEYLACKKDIIKHNIDIVDDNFLINYKDITKEIDIIISDKKIDVISVFYNNEDIINNYIHNIKILNSSRYDIVFHLINNNSSDDTNKKLEDTQKNFSNLYIYTNELNGCSSGRNIGLKSIRYDSNYVLFLDSDHIIYDKNILSTMIKNITNNIKYVGYYGGNLDDENYISGSLLEDTTEYVLNKNTVNKYIGCGVSLIDTILINKYKIKFDENYDPFCIEDVDFCIMVNKHAKVKKLINNNKQIIHHKHSTTSKYDTKSKKKLLNKNSIYFKFKHCISNNYYNNILDNNTYNSCEDIEYKNISLDYTNIGIISTLSYQGIGIQTLEYIQQIINKFNISIINYKSYLFDKTIIIPEIKRINKSNTLSIDNYNKYRHQLNRHDIVKYIMKYKPCKILIPEVSFFDDYSILHILKIFKEFKIEIISPINIETITKDDFYLYDSFVDKILVNNYSSYYIIKSMCKTSTILLNEFNLSSIYDITNKTSIKYNEKNNFIFTIFGGGNAKRKKIIKIYNIFNNLLKSFNNFRLNIYLMNTTVNDSIILKSTEYINIYRTILPLKDMLNIIKQSDFIFSISEYEGLGLDIYYALNLQTAVISGDNYPNKEFIINGYNGFLIEGEYIKNNNRLINYFQINLIKLENQIKYILNSENNIEILSIINHDKQIVNNFEKNFLNNLIYFKEYIPITNCNNNHNRFLNTQNICIIGKNNTKGLGTVTRSFVNNYSFCRLVLINDVLEYEHKYKYAIKFDSINDIENDDQIQNNIIKDIDILIILEYSFPNLIKKCKNLSIKTIRMVNYEYFNEKNNIHPNLYWCSSNKNISEIKNLQKIKLFQPMTTKLNKKNVLCR